MNTSEHIDKEGRFVLVKGKPESEEVILGCTDAGIGYRAATVLIYSNWGIIGLF